MLGFIVGEALRDLRRAGRVAASAVVLIAMSLVALGSFWILASNLGRAAAAWRDQVRMIAYLKREPAPAEVSGLLERVQEGGDVVAAIYVSKADALRSLRGALGKDAAVLEQLPANPLPASVEITLRRAAATPEGTRGLAARLAAMPEVEEVVGGVEWVERLAHWQRLLQAIGLGAGAFFSVAALLTVTTATTLVLHARRLETEIMRLVGASEIVVRMPLLLQGMAQGFLGALVALGVLVVGYRFAAPSLEPVVSLTLGVPRVEFLPAAALVALVAVGTLLGGFGGYLARGRAR